MIRFAKEKLRKLINLNKSLLIPIDNAQEVLAWEDSQRFIYENRGRNTKLYNDYWPLRSDAFAMRPKLGLIMDFGVHKATSTNFFADKLKDENDDRKLFGFDSFKGFSEETMLNGGSFPYY